jgi:plastocyanin
VARALAAALAALPLAALVGDAVTIVQQHRAFSVAQVTLPRGGVLHFSNQDDFTHEIYIDSPQFTFDSDEQEPGTTVTVTFPVGGHFPVRCHIHPKMHLDVDVQ